MSDVKYPSITVPLVGGDGNAYYMLGKVIRALKKAGIDEEEISTFKKEATSGDYDHLLATVMRWVNVE